MTVKAELQNLWQHTLIAVAHPNGALHVVFRHAVANFAEQLGRIGVLAHEKEDALEHDADGDDRQHQQDVHRKPAGVQESDKIVQRIHRRYFLFGRQKGDRFLSKLIVNTDGTPPSGSGMKYRRRADARPYVRNEVRRCARYSYYRYRRRTLQTGLRTGVWARIFHT